MKSWFDNCFI